MNKKLMALVIALLAVEQTFAAHQTAVVKEQVVAENGNCCNNACRTRCCVKPERCCRKPVRCFPRWRNCRTNWSWCCRPKTTCCPRIRCCQPKAKCCPSIIPSCLKRACVRSTCKTGCGAAYVEKGNGAVVAQEVVVE